MGKQLFKGMFGEEDSGVRRNNLFGLQYGQRRNKRNIIVHNGGWLNRKGEVLGWGDLDDRDFLNILMGLNPGEIFVIIHEGQFDEARYGNPPRVDTAIPDLEDVGVEALIKYAWLIITPEDYYFIPYRGTCGTEIRQGITFKIIGREKAEKILRG